MQKINKVNELPITHSPRNLRCEGLQERYMKCQKMKGN